MKNTTIEKHNEAVKQSGYTGTTTEFQAYVQFGKISSKEDFSTVGFTAEAIKQIVELLQHKDYAYSRHANYGIQVYYRDKKSPTGVSLAGGIPLELQFMLAAFNHTSELSPTEDKRTAH